MNGLITPVIMSGGAGTRLWPTSREARPKQLHRLTGERTLLQETLDRVATGGDGLFAPAVVVCNARYGDQVRAQLADLRHAPTLMLEPFGRNTAPVAACAAAWMIEQGRGADLVLLAPADHLMSAVAPFHDALRRAIPAAMDGRLVTLGIQPSHPETGYGYIRRGAPLGAIYEAAQFVEKPDRATAEHYLQSGDYLWNGGYFLFRADVMMAEIERLQPAIAAACLRAVREATRPSPDTIHLDPVAFRESPADSIDYAIMEKAGRIAVAPMDAGWSDLGSWQAVWEAAPKDGDGNAVQGHAVVHDARGCLVMSDGPTVSVCGLDDVAVIVHEGAVLVVPRARSQHVKHVVDALKARDRKDLL